MVLILQCSTSIQIPLKLCCAVAQLAAFSRRSRKTPSTLNQHSHRGCKRTLRACGEPAFSLYTMIRSNSWDYFRGIRPCQSLAAIVSPPALVRQIKCNPPLLFRWQILYVILWGYAPLSGPGLNLRAKVVNQALVVNAVGEAARNAPFI